MEEGEKRKITEERRVLQYFFVSLHLVIIILLMKSNLNNCGVCVCVCVEKEREIAEKKQNICVFKLNSSCIIYSFLAQKQWKKYTNHAKPYLIILRFIKLTVSETGFMLKGVRN